MSAGLTQRQLAGRAGIGLGALEDLEQGRTVSPREESLARLAVALELNPCQRAELFEVSAAVAGRGGAVPFGGRPRPGWPAVHLARLLADERRLLDELAYGGRSVRESLDRAYRTLAGPGSRTPATAAGAWRLLGRCQCASITAAQAACLFRQPVADATVALEALVDAGLLASPGPASYRLPGADAHLRRRVRPPAARLPAGPGPVRAPGALGPGHHDGRRGLNCVGDCVGDCVWWPARLVVRVKDSAASAAAAANMRSNR